MIRLTALCTALLAVAVAMPSLAQSEPQTPATPAETPPQPPPVPEKVYETVRVAIATSEGPIMLALEKERAPVTTANFLRYVDQKRLDGTAFYRALKVSDDGSYGLIQGGTQGNLKAMLPPIAHEPTTKTGLSHIDGAVSMARGAPGSAAGDFFITVGALESLNADPSKPGDNLGFAVFGHVVEGMDTVRRIMNAPTSPTLGEGAMKGQMIASPVRILTARRAQ
ncbi:peptidylprolyl isomerase [Sphingosinicella microcystinivorans]|uniref:peptidylprolyl isomerase n=1 Tax=Sphingosinicella microcystinivorans TaxID=335406 RepID=UPI0022F3BFEB|nr:peptidylprolyl isomerase [Sphingosinicella microcystinivorans]WBX86105.1 peptidylprolyl isomerase [Sphingosinicella microcystinivorans]